MTGKNSLGIYLEIIFCEDGTISAIWPKSAIVPDGQLFKLVSHYSGIGDTISCDAPYSAIGFRGKLFLRYPLVRSVLDCDRPVLWKDVRV